MANAVIDRICKDCGLGEDDTRFYPDRLRCKPCQSGWQRNKDRGITTGDYESMVYAQTDRCWICGDPETSTRDGHVRRLAIDHDHVTGHIRGLLCNNCNTGLGNFRDTPYLLSRAAEYIKERGCPLLPWTSFTPSVSTVPTPVLQTSSATGVSMA